MGGGGGSSVRVDSVVHRSNMSLETKWRWGGGAAVFIFRFTVYVIVKCFSIELSGQWYTQVHCAFINLVLNMGYITVNSSVQN